METIDDIAVIVNEPLNILPAVDVVLWTGDDEHAVRQLVQITVPTDFDSLVISTHAHSLIEPVSNALDAVHNFRAVLRNIKNGLLNIVGRGKKPTNCTTMLFDTRAITHVDVGSLMMYILPVCLKIKQVLGDGVEFIFRPMHSDLLDLIRYFGIEPLVSNGAFLGTFLKFNIGRRVALFDVFDTKLFDINHNPPISLLGSFGKSVEMIKKPEYERVFLTQKRNATLSNQLEVVQLLEAHGYQTVDLDEYSVEDRVAIAASAKHVVAIHSPLMAYLVVNQAMQSIIEVFPPNVHHEIFPISINHRVKQYQQIMPSFDQRVACIGWDAIFTYKTTPFNLSVKALALALNEVQY